MATKLALKKLISSTIPSLVTAQYRHEPAENSGADMAISLFKCNKGNEETCDTVQVAWGSSTQMHGAHIKAINDEEGLHSFLGHQSTSYLGAFLSHGQFYRHPSFS